MSRRRPPQAFIHARTCYGHLAGEVAVKILHAMLKQRWLRAKDRNYSVTRRGQAKLAALDIDIVNTGRQRRVLARECMDLTQRRPHLAGALGDALLQTWIARGWLRRQPDSRVVNVTASGRAAFRREFGM